MNVDIQNLEAEVPTTKGTVTVRELRTMVMLLDPHIVKMHEVTPGTPETIETQTQIALELVGDHRPCALILDLTDADVPKAAYRKFIRTWLKELPFVHIAVVNAKSALARAAAMFLLGGSGRSTSIHKTLDEALARAREECA